MRTLELNKTKLWLVNPIGFTDKVDPNGLYTGDIIRTYGTPIEIRLTLYPATGTIVESIFGHNVDIDMVSVTTDLVLTPDSLLFETQPTGDYFETYTYKVEKILKSLNNYVYGFKRRK